MKRRWSRIPGIFLVLCGTVTYADQIDLEIAQLKKELSRVHSQRNDEQNTAQKEKTEFVAYQKRTAEKYTILQQQTDSIVQVIATITRTNDSLSREDALLEQKIKDQETVRRALRDAILSATSVITGEIKVMTPLVREQALAPLTYLSGEIAAGSVDNTEALFRLLRIVQDVRAVSQEIQVVEGVSPVPDLRGTIYRLRIGAVFEAVVDMAGTRGFIWNDSLRDGNGKWVPIDNAEVCTSLHAAVLMREGKKIPSLVQIPFGTIPGAKHHE